MMYPVVSADTSSTYLFAPLSRIRSRRGENVLAVLPADYAVSASTMLRPVNTSARALNSEDRACAVVIAKSAGSASGPYRSTVNVAANPGDGSRRLVYSAGIADVLGGCASSCCSGLHAVPTSVAN